MKKLTGRGLQGIVLITFLFVLALPYTLYPIPLYAQESSPSSSLIEKLNALKEDIASKAAEIKKEVTQKVQNRASFGTILDISQSEITIQTQSLTKTVKYDEFSEVIGLKNKKIKSSDLEVGDKIAALGDVDDKNILVAKRLVYLQDIASNSAQLIWGQIQKTTGSIITIKTKDGASENILTTSQTVFFLGNNEASINDAKVEKHLTARATQLKDGSLRARFIYFIPSSGFIKPIKDSSPSASTKR